MLLSLAVKAKDDKTLKCNTTVVRVKTVSYNYTCTAPMTITNNLQ